MSIWSDRAELLLSALDQLGSGVEPLIDATAKTALRIDEGEVRADELDGLSTPGEGEDEIIQVPGGVAEAPRAAPSPDYLIPAAAELPTS